MILYHDPVVNAVMNDVYSVNKSIDYNSKITFRDEHEEKKCRHLLRKVVLPPNADYISH